MILVTRADCRILPPTQRMETAKPSRGVVIHCTGGREPSDPRDAVRAWNATWWGHVAPPEWVEVTDEKTGKKRLVNRGGNGWSDIGYNFGFNDHGQILEGRGWKLRGAHCPKRNSTGRGLVYQGKGLNPTPLALEALAYLIEEHDKLYGEGYVIGHRDVSRKSCPGDGLYAAICERWGDRNPFRRAA